MLSSQELSRLWNQHSSALLLMVRGRFGSAAAHLAEDCVQEAFIRLATQDPVPFDPATWLIRVVKNAAIDLIRSNRRRTERETRVASQRPEWLEIADTATLDLPSPKQIENALLQLDDITRDIVIAHVWNNMTFRQIAEAFELSSATTHRKYEAGISMLRSIITRQSERIPNTS